MAARQTTNGDGLSHVILDKINDGWRHRGLASGAYRVSAGLQEGLSGQWVERNLCHREIFGVVGDQGQLVVGGYGGNEQIREAERFTFFAVVTFPAAGLFGDGEGDGEELQTA